MKIIAFLLKAFQHSFVLYGFANLIFWISFGLKYWFLGPDSVTVGTSIINAIWAYHIDYPLICLIDFFAVVYLVHFMINNE